MAATRQDADAAQARLLPRRVCRFGAAAPPPGDALLDLEGEDLDDEGRAVAPSGRRQERRKLLERGVVIDIEQDGDVFKKRANTLLRSALRRHCGTPSKVLWRDFFLRSAQGRSGGGGALCARSAVQPPP
jgi:hypothetical protein